jgi:citrate lyase beta subunit
MFGGVKLRDVLAEYRRKHAPWTSIDLSAVDEAIGIVTGLSIPAVEGAPQTPRQKQLERAAKAMRRCRKLLAVIEQHERLS